MAKKKFVLRIDEATLAAAERWAADDFRSINQQLEWMITQSLLKAGRLRNAPPPSEEKESEEAEN